ncbi:hypothetical protein ACFRCG_03460 [Embleya sp. NPDC056575]|uniref:hypothetical protein n=1 Tax=unclassified Embleya TaxID=2699296 RepID=UPI003689BFBE
MALSACTGTGRTRRRVAALVAAFTFAVAGCSSSGGHAGDEDGAAGLDNAELVHPAFMRRLAAQAREVRSVRLTLRTTDGAPSEAAAWTVTLDVDIRAQGLYRGVADSPSGHAEFRRTAKALYVKGDRGYWRGIEDFRDRPAAVDAVAGSFVEVPTGRQPASSVDTLADMGDLPAIARLIATGPTRAAPRPDAGPRDEILFQAPPSTGNGVFHFPARGTRTLPTRLTVAAHVDPETGKSVPGAVTEWSAFDLVVLHAPPAPDTIVPWPAAALGQ